MSLTVIVTRDMEARFRGFLSSIAQEVAPGVYVSPRLSAGVRDRAWAVVSDWFGALNRGGEAGGSIIMAYADRAVVGGVTLRALGTPPREFVDVDGLLMARRRAPDPDAGET